MGVGPVGFSVEQQNLLWAMWRRGDSIREMERTLGETLPRIRRFLRQSGGIPPVPRRRRASHLAVVEREEISRGIAAGLTARTIAGRIGRPSSTVSTGDRPQWWSRRVSGAGCRCCCVPAGAASEGEQAGRE
jgi:Helix-turn-helix domain